MPVGARSHSFDMSNSQVPRVLLQVNPGLDRQLERHLSLMDHLDKKRQRTWMSEKHNFRDSFHNRMDKRRRIYQRQRMKMDLDDTRKVVDAIKADRAQASLLRRGSQSITQSQKRSKKAIEGESNDMSGRAWTPASAMESMSRNWDHTSQSHLPQTLAAAAADGTEVDHPLTSVAPPGQSSALSSRRSSFKSSIMELDPSGRADSPGPTHSNDPLAALSVAPKPGVIVTQPPDKERTPSPLADEDITKLKAPEDKIWKLLPAPTPTRFVGKMHAVLTTPKRNSKSTEASQKSLSDTFISEDQNNSTVDSNRESEEQDQVGEMFNSPLNSPLRSTFGQVSEDEEIIKKTEGIKKHNSNFQSLEQQSPGVPTSARFLAKVKGHKVGTAETPHSERMGEVGGKISSALSKRNAWKSTIQASKDDTQSVKGSPRFSLKRMTSTLSSNQNNTSGGGWKKFNPSLAVGAAASMAFGNRGHSSKHSRLRESGLGSNGAIGTRAIGKTRVQLFRKSSTDVIQGFGIRQLSNDAESVKIPGMKRGFSVIENTEGQTNGAMSHPLNVSRPNPEPDLQLDTSSKQENAFKAGQVLAKTGFLRKKPEMRLLESADQPQAGSPDASLGSITSLVKGIPTTSKLVSKLHSMRAQQDGEMGDPDDKWDWMTGVPTSIRFLVKSWKTIDRGPGGIITDAPSKLTQTREVPDFTATVNMLTVLAKADMKLKAQSREDREEEDSDSLEKRRGSRRKSSNRRPSHVGVIPKEEVPGKPVQRDSLTTRPLSRGSSLKTDSDPLTHEVCESDAFLSQLLGPLRLVETETIPKWNMDKTIQEETGGQPFFLKLDEHD